MAVQQRRYMEAAVYHACFAGRSPSLFLVFCRFLEGVCRFVAGILHPSEYGLGLNREYFSSGGSYTMMD
jgi:hypothetical protein